MSTESGPKGLKKHRLPDAQRKKSRNEFIWYFGVGTLASTALLTGTAYGIDHFTDAANGAIHWAGLPSNWIIPNFPDAGINALGGAINSIPHANILPNLAAEHLSGISSNPNFWGVSEAVGAVAGGSRGLILGYEYAKRRITHSAGVFGESVAPGAARVKKSVDAAHNTVKAGNILVDALETVSSIPTMAAGSPIGINDLLGLTFVLTGYRPGKGIMTAADLIGMSILLATPLPTVTTWDILKGAAKAPGAILKHMQTIADHAKSVRK